MADTYIDQHETVIYGKFAREQFLAVCLGKVPALDGAVQFAVSAQATADAAMQAVLDRQPKPAASSGDTLTEVREVIVRFGSYLGSLKGQPVDVKTLFQGDAPSVLARRRLSKMVGTLRHITEQFKARYSGVRDAAAWQAELDDALAKADALDVQQRGTKQAKADLAPEVAAAREQWLETYAANKLLSRGLLAHARRPELLSLVFDDLAQEHHAVGVSDTPPADPKPT